MPDALLPRFILVPGAVRPCGYAPRAMLLGRTRLDTDRLYIGCKDGSVAIVETGRGSEILRLPCQNRRAIRALCEWDSERLIVGRSDGSVDLIHWSGLSTGTGDEKVVSLPLASGEIESNSGQRREDAVSVIRWLEQDLLLISFRRSGTRVYRATEDEGFRHLAEAGTGEGFLSSLRGVRLVERTTSGMWLLVTGEGQLWIWGGEIGEGPRPLSLWGLANSPGFVNDTATLPSANGSARSIVLATDTGVFLIDLTPLERGDKPGSPVRLALPGLGAVCMALTYAETGGYGLLWAADTRGDSHLFWQEMGCNEPSFQPSGMVRVGSQVMLAISWSPSTDRAVFAQARRDDHVAFDEYRLFRQERQPSNEKLWTEDGVAERSQALQRYRELLRQASVADLKRELPRKKDDGPSGKRPPYTFLADFFELLASQEDSLRVLQEFLSSPSADVGAGILRGSKPDAVGDAIRCWNLTLLGIINRTRGDRELSYLGVVRWLQDLGKTQVPPEASNRLVEEVSRGIRFARKWGLFGEANTRRGNLVRPLEILRKQLGASGAGESEDFPDIGGEPEALDLLTYEALLFHRGADQILLEASGEMLGRTGWDIATVEIHGRRLVAVSWIWGGIDLYELKSEGPGHLGLEARLVITSGEDGEPRSEPVSPASHRQPSENWQQKYGYSRAVLLGKLGEAPDTRCFLLTAPTRQPGAVESLYLWNLEADGQRIEATLAARAELEPGESIYRLLGLEEGWIFAGLRGRGGSRRVAILRIEAGEEGLRLRHRTEELKGAMPQAGLGKTPDPPAGEARGRDTVRNRVWSLARSSLLVDGEHRLAVGFEDGEIWGVRVPCRGSLEKCTLRGEKIARMSSPVTALAYLEEGGNSRIIAGSSDGSVVAWQLLEEKDGGERRFASLWATLEQGPISGIHAISYGPSGLDADRRLILVVTRNGRSVVFDGRPRVEPSGTQLGQRPHRALVPGGRLGRPRLGDSVYASVVLPDLPASHGGEPIWNQRIGRYAVALTASGHGTLQLVSFHFPYFKDIRRGQLARILTLWWQIVRRTGQPWDRLRLADATYEAVPLLPLILVRWALDPDWPHGASAGSLVPTSEEFLEVEDWAIPTYLRPLRRLSRTWIDKKAAAAGKALEDLLTNAWRLGDVDLFQELCIVTLKRANQEIFRAATEAEMRQDVARFCSLYIELFEAIERSLQRWLGAPGRGESRARIVVAKNLVDGETFWRVLLEAAGEKDWKAPFFRILSKRIDGVRQLVFKRDSLVSLEALRALNLSLLRLCVRLSAHRKEGGWSPLREGEVDWEVFRLYFEQLIHAAASTFRSRSELSDALAHEYCRTFAMMICVCPSATVRITNRMTETQLISDPRSEQDLSRQVLHQLRVLRAIGIVVPEEVFVLFRLASSPPENGIDPLRPMLPELGLQRKWLRSQRGKVGRMVGRQNAEDLYCLSRLYSVVEWIVRLEEKLSTDARDIDLTERERCKALRALTPMETKPDLMQDLYSHSTRFWRDALAEMPVLERMSREKIRPEMVLKSQRLAKWAGCWKDELDNRYTNRGIFQPEYLIFREVLGRLERAAAEFPRSAAVQKNVVLAVFGHHLLEDLDEHVFELEELAQNLDPLKVWSFRNDSSPPRRERCRSVAQEFADYLLRRAHHAESIPKNLRALHGILDSGQDAGSILKPDGASRDYAAEEAGEDDEKIALEKLFEPYIEKGWLPPKGSHWFEASISPREFRFLSLILAELERNERNHSDLGEDLRKSPSIHLKPRDAAIEIRFWFKYDDRNFERLLELSRDRKDLQEPLRPQPSRKVPSTGAGLYLANLAAATVSWKLQIRTVKRDARRSSRAFCVFRLERPMGSGADSGEVNP